MRSISGKSWETNPWYAARFLMILKAILGNAIWLKNDYTKSLIAMKMWRKHHKLCSQHCARTSAGTVMSKFIWGIDTEPVLKWLVRQNAPDYGQQMFAVCSRKYGCIFFLMAKDFKLCMWIDKLLYFSLSEYSLFDLFVSESFTHQICIQIYSLSPAYSMPVFQSTWFLKYSIIPTTNTCLINLIDVTN